MEFSDRFMCSVIDREMSIIDVLSRLGVINRQGYSVNRSCFCCFHDNHDTPAAKLYSDECGITMYCFSEQKSYRSSDAFKQFSSIPIHVVFNKVWQSLSQEEKNYYMDRMNADSNKLTDEWRQTISKLADFRKRRITYNDVLDIILEEIDKEVNNA